MSVQHLLLAKDGNNTIIEKEEFESPLEISAPMASAAGTPTDNQSGRQVAVNKHYYRGKYYAVAVERHAASNDIDDLIELVQLRPID